MDYDYKALLELKQTTIEYLEGVHIIIEHQKEIIEKQQQEIKELRQIIKNIKQSKAYIDGL